MGVKTSIPTNAKAGKLTPRGSSTSGVAQLFALLLIAALLISLAVSASSASAATAGPGWAIASVALPTNFAFSTTEGCETRRLCDVYRVTVTNTGTSPSSGPVVVKDTLPTGIPLHGTAGEITAEDLETEATFPCIEPATSQFQCTYEGAPVQPGAVLEITIKVRVTGSGEASVTNHAEVEGGGVPAAATSEPSTVANTVNAQDPAFGIQDFSVGVHGPSGASDAQAGDHPGALTTTIDS